MQANWREIIAIFDDTKNYALATIVSTRGATYQKTGAMMLIDAQGKCTGLLSGGCLEADISLHAEQVLEQKNSKVICYDLKADADLLWGLGLGCDGALDILVQPLLVENQHLGFSVMVAAIAQREQGYYLQAFDLSNKQKSLAKGEFILSEHSSTSPHRKVPASAAFIDGANQYLVTPIMPPLSLLICGAGPDVVAVVNIAEHMGWQVTLWDHRQAHLAQAPFKTCSQRCVRANNTQEKDYADFDAVIVMTHNLTMDGEYLIKLLATSISYIGLLGPFSRRDKLLAQAKVDSPLVVGRVYGPAGLNLGGRGPEAIALSMASEIQQHFSKKYNDGMFKSYQVQVPEQSQEKLAIPQELSSHQ